MGKMNYVNRKIEGRKLGQVVNKDLLKRIPPNAGSKAAFRDPVVELDISGKALTDEGLLEIGIALEASLSYNGDQGKCARLEELSLRENQLTVVSLRTLAQVIRLACNDLRDLDLSGNDIVINTEGEMDIWEGFLESFEQCSALRRIDFSGNALGSRAFEILQRVYAKEAAVNIAKIPNSKVCEDDVRAMNDRTQHATLQSIPATTRGLRSVPYLVLANTGMTDFCALHLSFIVASHHQPSQLLEFVPMAKAGAHANQIESYDESGCRGIVYFSNEQLSNAGLRVLELAEKRRDSGSKGLGDAVFESSQSDLETTKPSIRRTSEAGFRAANVSTTAKRRRSTVHTDREDEAGDLDRARARIEGDTLQEAGPQSNDIWWSALKMLALGRNIQPQIRRDPSPLPPPPKAKGPIVKTLIIPAPQKPKKLKPLHTSLPLMAERDPNQRLNPWNTDFGKKAPIAPAPQAVPARSLTDDIQIETYERSIDPPIPIKMDTKYRTKLPCGFSEDVWRKILAHSLGVQHIISDGQQLSVLRWAMDRKTLIKEREALGLTRAAQIWRVLEGTSCLAYEMNA